MDAVKFDGHLHLTKAHLEPHPGPGWAKIRVRLAGICQTDLEIIKGYMGFSGILGHEFVGTVSACEESKWIGRRVVGEINAACGSCQRCRAGMATHCARRKVLGIDGLDGCMAKDCLLPVGNLRAVPDSVSDQRAVFTEPLAAAWQILEQVKPDGDERAVVLGDGRLGILSAWVLATAVRDVTLVGRHPWKLDLARWRHLKTAHVADPLEPDADLVVEATGSPDGLARALALCRPRGTVVVKTTVAGETTLALAPMVVNEQKLMGSRCGPFGPALKMLRDFPDLPVEGLISATYPLFRAPEAFARAQAGDVIKVLVECS